MVFYPESAVERAMKIQEVILRAMAKRLTWCQAAGIIGISDRQMRRWYRRYQEFGYDGLFDRRRGRPSPKRVAVETVEQISRTVSRPLLRSERAALLREVARGTQHLSELHLGQDGPARSRAGAQGASARRASPATLRRPLPGMLVHLDGSRHRWFQDDRWYDLLVVLDDATTRGLLRPTGRGRIDAHRAGGPARNRPAPGNLLRTLQRSRQPFLCHAPGRRED